MRAIFFLLLISCSSLTFAQSNRIIAGKVLDQDSGRPVAYAHVGIPELGIGTTTGGTGQFLLKVPARFADSELIVSFIGYKTFRKPLRLITGPVTVYLQETPTHLQEIIVLDEAVVENIVRKAVKRIPKNYPHQPSGLKGFYRESRTDAENNYIYMAEGVLELYKTSYRNDKEGQVSLVEGRLVELLPAEEVDRTSNFSSGHMSGHRFDFVKNREDFIDEAFFPVYKYWLEGITSYNDRPVFVIGFDRDEDAGQAEAEGGIQVSDLWRKSKRRSSPSARMTGKMFIDTLSYAFLRAEFEIRPEALKKYDDYPLYSGAWKGNRYIVNYRQQGNKWYFGDAVREGIYHDGGMYTNEFLATEVRPDKAAPIPYEQRLGRHVTFRHRTGAYDPNFWTDYNITPMSGELESTVLQLNNQHKAEEIFDTTFMAALQRQRDSLRMLELQKIAVLENENPEEVDLQNGTNVRREVRRRLPMRARVAFGAGIHMLKNKGGTMGLSYLTDIERGTSLDAFTTLEKRQFEVPALLDFDVVFKNKWFIRIGYAPEFYNSIYKHRSEGLGFQFNLSRYRPFYFRTVFEHSNLQYARKIGQAVNELSRFKADGKKFKSDKVNMYYGSRIHNLKTSLELSWELDTATELFVRASYLIPFANKKYIYLWERDRFFLFRKKVRLPIDDRVMVERNDASFTGNIAKFQSAIFSIGIIKTTH